MEFTSGQIALLLNGQLEGDSSVSIKMVGKIETASSNQLAFLSNPVYEKHLYTTQAGAVLVKKGFVPKEKVNSTLIFVDDPYASLTFLLKEYDKLSRYSKKGIEQPSQIDDSAIIGSDLYLGAFSYVGKGVNIGNNVKIHPQCYIGERVSIGNNTLIYPGVKIYDGTVIGNDCIIHSGAVLGSDGFGFAPLADGSYDTIPQLGTVTIEDQVSIGANTVIDRATLPGEITLIKKGAKLDNLIQIAHNVVVGNHTVIAAQTGISGSTKIGNRCMFGGQVGIAGHLEIANGTQIAAQAGISKSIKEEKQRVIGYPAFGFTDYFKSYSVFKTLPELSKRITKLELDIHNKNGNK